MQSSTALDQRFFKRFLAEQRKALKVPWAMAMARDRGYECATGTETVPAWQRRILAAMTWPMFNLITGAAREDAVVDEHFARVFNLDESLADMMTSPRVLAGLLRYKVNSALGRPKLPFGFDCAAGASGHGLDTGRGLPPPRWSEPMSERQRVNR